jgi:hypothetical protein
MAQGDQRSLGLIAAHGQFGSQGAGKDLLGRLEAVQRHLRQDLRGAPRIVLVKAKSAATGAAVQLFLESWLEVACWSSCSRLASGVRGSSPRLDEGELAQAANRAARQRAVNSRRQAIM